MLLALAVVGLIGGITGGLIGFALHSGATVAGEAHAWMKGWHERGEIEDLRHGTPE